MKTNLQIWYHDCHLDILFFMENNQQNSNYEPY